MDKLVIVGISTTAETIYHFVCHYNLFDVIGFAVNKEYIQSNSFLGKPIYALESLDEIIDTKKDYVFVSMQWNRLNADRRKVYETLKKKGYRFANIISPQSACVWLPSRRKLLDCRYGLYRVSCDNR